MNGKNQMLAQLKEEFERWEELLASLSEEQITAAHLPQYLSIHDVVAHLMAWQKISIARLEAAQVGGVPVFPDWLMGLDPESERDIDQYNANIFEVYHLQPWTRVHQGWRDGYQRLLQLVEAIPDEDILDTAKYPWLKGYDLMAVLEGTYEHHHIDHLLPLRAWMRDQGNMNFGERGGKR